MAAPVPGGLFAIRCATDRDSSAGVERACGWLAPECRLAAFLRGLTVLIGCAAGTAQAAVFTIADGDVAGLIAAINTANGNAQADVINLAAAGSYTLTTVDNTSAGPNGLPLLTGDSAPLVINGNGALLRRNPASADMRLLRLASGSSLTLNNLRLENGRTSDSGGAILSGGTLVLTGCALSNHSAGGDGGAVMVEAGSLAASSTLFANNEAGLNGGGLLNLGNTAVNLDRVRLHANHAEQNGGGLANLGTALISASLIDANTTGSANGAGIFTQFDLELIGSTVSGNLAGGPVGGVASAAGAVRIDQSTVTANQAGSIGGVFINPLPGNSLRLRNSLVAGNSGAQVSGAQGPGSGNNLTAGTPGIGVLRDNGGPLPTHALLPSSSAINGGNNSIVPAGSFDMRGYARISGAQVDIGAVEFQQPLLLLQTSGSGQSAALLGAFANPLQLTASEANGILIVGLQISYAAPAAGASATFPGGTSFSTNLTGSVQAAVVANAIPGNYLVNASTVGGGLTASTSFNLGNLGSDLSLSLSNGVGSATPGLPVSYTLVVNNPGPAAVAGVMVSDVFPATLDCNWTSVATGGASGNGAGSGNLNQVLSLPAGSSVTYTIPCDVDPGASGTLVNSATLSAVGDVNPANNSASDSDPLNAQADVSISKSNGVGSSIPGTDTVYTITASNAGPSHAPGITIVDAFPAICGNPDWSCTATGGGSCAPNGSGNISEPVNLPVAGSVSFTATCSIDPAASGTLVNSASASLPPAIVDPVPANNSASDSDTLATLPSLSINDASLLEGSAGNTVFEFNVSLSAPALAGGVRFDVATANGSAAGGVDYLPLLLADQLIPEGTTSSSIQVMVIGDGLVEATENFLVNLSNLRGATAADLQGTGTIVDDDTATSIISNRPDPSVVGQSYLVTVEVTSFATAPSGTVFVSDGAGPGSASCGPATLAPVSAIASRASCALVSLDAVTKRELGAVYTPDGGDLTGSSGNAFHRVDPASTIISVSGPARTRLNTPTLFSFDLAVVAPGGGDPVGMVTLSTAGSSCMVSVPTATPACELSLTTLGPNTIEADYVPADGNHLASSSSAAGNAESFGFVLADLTLGKTVAATSFRPDDLIVYTITLTNPGPDEAVDLRLLDIAPPELINVLWTCDSSGGISCPQSNGSGDIDVLLADFPVGGLLNYTLAGNVNGAPLQIVNNAAIELPVAGTVEDPDLANNSASAVILRESLFVDGFEAATVNAAEGEYRLPSEALRSLLDHNAWLVFRLTDSRGESGRVYARILNGSVQYALAQRVDRGTLQLGAWRAFGFEPSLRWRAAPTESGWAVLELRLE
jgi:uncharacterized repeat protein (TIGR01451 family)